MLDLPYFYNRILSFLLARTSGGHQPKPLLKAGPTSKLDLFAQSQFIQVLCISKGGDSTAIPGMPVPVYFMLLFIFS